VANLEWVLEMQINDSLFVEDDGHLRGGDAIERSVTDGRYITYANWNNHPGSGFTILFHNKVRNFAIIDCSPNNNRLFLIGKKGQVVSTIKEQFVDYLRMNHSPFFEWLLWNPL